MTIVGRDSQQSTHYRAAGHDKGAKYAEAAPVKGRQPKFPQRTEGIEIDVGEGNQDAENEDELPERSMLYLSMATFGE